MKQYMKTYPYNRTSTEGRKLFRLLDTQYNPGILEQETFGGTAVAQKQLEAHTKSAVMQCRANGVSLIFESNLSGLKRPQIHIDADVEMAWGDFSDDAKTLDFTHGEELPLTYVQPLEDDTIKALIDAGAYSDPRFEELLSKLITDEPFDVEGDMSFHYIDVGDAAVNQGETGRVPVVLAEPVNIVHEDEVKSQYTSVTNLVNRSAALVIELRKEGVKTDDLVSAQLPEQDREVYIDSDFTDVIAERETAQQAAASDDLSLVEPSELLDQEVDVTDKLAGSLSFEATDEDDIIRDLKERDRERGHTIDMSTYGEPEDDVQGIDPAPEALPTVFDFNVAEGNYTEPSETTLDADAFDGESLDDLDFEDDEDELER